MNMIRHTTTVLVLATTLSLPGIVRADEAAQTAEPNAAAPTATPELPAPGMGMGMGRGMGPGMGMGPMDAERCQMRKAGMMGINSPSRTMDADKRIEMLEKRLDTMQLTLELLVRQQASSSGR
ncbi:MAG: hypothetical protein ACLGG6_04155 [Gammaproteobacteria bacterium]